MHRYGFIIYWSSEDQVFVAEVPELPGCAAHGGTPAKALAEAQQAISLWLDTAREFGDPIPEPKPERKNLWLEIADRRLQEMRDGKVREIPADEVFARR